MSEQGSNDVQRPKSKNQLRRERKKLQKLEAEAGNQPVSTPTHTQTAGVAMLARKYEWINESSPVFEMYKQVSSRFKRKYEEALVDNEDDVQNENQNDNDNQNEIEDENEIEDKDENENTNTNTSEIRGENETKTLNSAFENPAKELKKLTLAELKASTSRPELVDWYDCDSKEPSYLVFLKTLPNTVQVPANWRASSEIPRFAPQPPYTLPPNIARSGIIESYAASSDGVYQGKLDVDYERMYSAFNPDDGKPQTDWKRLSTYGEIATLRGFPSKPGAVMKEKPTFISDKLYKALGLTRGDKLPWESVISEMGPAPGYLHSHSNATTRWGVF